MSIQTYCKSVKYENLWVRATLWACLLLFLVVLGLSLTPVVNAGTVTDENVIQKVTGAKSADDHEALAAYYRAKASDAAAQVAHHKKMRESYKGVGRLEGWSRQHCGELIRSYLRAQEEYENLAAEHEREAREMSGKR